MNELVRPGNVVNPFHPNRAIIFSLLALVLVVLSFHGALDTLASSKLHELIKESLGLLLVSRGINAAVSVLQTIQIPLVSVQIGQILDPVNDAAERLSVALLWATGSLLLQDILLKLSSGSLFKWGYLAIAVTTAASLWLALSDRIRIALATNLRVSHAALAQCQGLLIKTLIVATIVRFIVPTFMIASLLVSQALVAPEIVEHSQELERQERSLSQVGTQISEARDEVVKEQSNQDEFPTNDETGDSASDEEIPQISSPSAQPEPHRTEDLQFPVEHKVQLEETLTLLESERRKLESERKSLSNKISELQSSDWKGWIRKFTGNPEEALAEANAWIDQFEAEIAQKQSKVSCIDRPAAREECEFYLVELRQQALTEVKIQLESEQEALRERLQSLQEERKKAKAEIGGDAKSETASTWRDKVVNALPDFLGDDATEGVEATKRRDEDIDRELANASAQSKQKSSELTCVNRRMIGEHCDSPHIDDHMQSVLNRLQTQLDSDLQLLRAELTSRQGERERLEELGKLRAERRQVESGIEENKKLIDRTESELECAERRLAGEDCDTIVDDGRQLMSETWTSARGMMSNATEAAGKGLSSAGHAAVRVASSVTEVTNRAFSKMSLGVRDRFNAILDDASDMVTRMTQILVLKVIENIALPIIFLAIALKGAVPMARGLMRISTMMNEDIRAALSAMDQALPSRKG